MRFTKLAVAIAASGGAVALSLFATSPAVAATAATSYQANLQALNNSGASGTLMLTLNGEPGDDHRAHLGSRRHVLRQPVPARPAHPHQRQGHLPDDGR